MLRLLQLLVHWPLLLAVDAMTKIGTQLSLCHRVSLHFPVVAYNGFKLGAEGS